MNEIEAMNALKLESSKRLFADKDTGTGKTLIKFLGSENLGSIVIFMK